jgi:hypothetical protein
MVSGFGEVIGEPGERVVGMDLVVRQRTTFLWASA